MDNPFITKQENSNGEPQVDFVLTPVFKLIDGKAGFTMPTGEKSSDGKFTKTLVSDFIEGEVIGFSKSFYRHTENDPKDFFPDEEGTEEMDGVRGFRGDWQMKIFLNKEGKNALVRFNVCTGGCHSILNTIIGAESINNIKITLKDTGKKNSKGGDIIQAVTAINGDYKSPWKYTIDELNAMDIVAKVGSVTVKDTSPKYIRLLDEAVAKKPIDMEKREELISQLAELDSISTEIRFGEDKKEEENLPFKL